MITHICPACGYPTLNAALCAFCGPGEVRFGNQAFGQMSSATTFNREIERVAVRDIETGSAVNASIWSNPLAS
jgi:hypothetical protein